MPRTSSTFRTIALIVILAAWTLLLFRLDQVPPGFQHDQMFNSRDALTVLQGNYPFYFPANFGRPPLGIYWTAAIFRLIGEHYVWSMRFAGVICGMVVLATTFTLARRYLLSWGALLAGALLAGSFWFLFSARLGMESMLLMALAAPMLCFLDRGLARRNWPDLLVAGVLAGLANYTYLAARAIFALPVLLLVQVGAVALLARLGIGRRYPASGNGRFATVGLFLFALVMLLVSGPVLLYVQANADAVDRRLGELGGPLSGVVRGDLGPILRTIQDTLLALVWRAPDLLPFHYNVPARPVLHPLLGAFFLIGLLITLRRWRSPHESLLLAGLLLGLVPSLLSSPDALHMRSVIALPLIFILTARGLWEVGSWLAARSAFIKPAVQPGLTQRVLLPTFVIVATFWHGATSSQAYFVDWAQAEPTQRIYNADLRAAAAYAYANTRDEPVFIGTDRLFDLDQLTYELYQPRRSDVHWFHLPESLPLPDRDHTLYLMTGLPEDYSATWDILQPAMHDSFSLPGPGNRYTLLYGFRLSPAEVQQRLAEAGIRQLQPALTYGNALVLEAAGASQSGSQAKLAVVWRTLATWPAQVGQPLPLKYSISLTDSAGYQWLHTDISSKLPLLYWQPGERYLDVVSLDLPADLPPTDYQVRAVVYHDTSGTLPVGRDGNSIAAAPQVAALRITSPISGTVSTPPYPIESVQPSPALQPLGRWEPLESLLLDAPNDVHVSWRANQELPASQLHFQLAALGEDGRYLWQQAADPLASLPAVWPQDQTYRLAHRIVPHELPAGVSQIQLELCVGQAGAPDSCAILASPQVKRQPALMTLPALLQVNSGANWDGHFVLEGYDLVLTADGAGLTLYWRIENAPLVHLRRFVHAVDASGTIIAQSDALPANGEIPMSFWRPGEYVVDSVGLQWPSDQPVAAFYVGWYDPETGERLPVLLSEGSVPPDLRLRLYPP